ncbi:MAG: hypothetical protein JOZ70_01600 [Pseudolabrys sp.]|nr:hypothetical protein [Pseudolabrys sp.]MBV9953919.1 hypothetical protein [Pseudolabrys sp.]
MKFILSLTTAGALLFVIPMTEQAQAQDQVQETRIIAPKRRPQVVITPGRQRLSANARRQCETELVREFRPSGTVIVPRTTCWWQ